MELGFAWWIVSALLSGGAFVLWFLRRVNEWYYVCKVGKTAYPLPPGDMGWPFLGNMLSVVKALRSGDHTSFVYSLISRYGKFGIYKSHLFGSPSIIICTPELCRRVMTNDECFEFGYPASTYTLTGRKGLHAVSDVEHRHLRRLIANPISGYQALTNYIEHVEDIVINSLDELASMNKPFEFFVEMKTITFKIMTYIFISSISDSLLWRTRNLYNDFREGLISMAIDIPGFAFNKALKARRELVKILQSILNEKRMTTKSNQHKRRKDMMDLLIEVKDEDGEKLEDEHIVDLILGSFAAGFESSAFGALWAIVHLSEHPEALKKAKKEQEEILNRRPSTQKGINFMEIKQMEYLAKVIDETLRKLNVFPFFRKARVNVSINGYTVPKGWKVLVWPSAVHMDPEIYVNPQDFDPSRWDKVRNKATAFMPFGAGSRLCPGSDLAKLVITIILHYYLLNYNMIFNVSYNYITLSILQNFTLMGAGSNELTQNPRYVSLMDL